MGTIIIIVIADLSSFPFMFLLDDANINNIHCIILVNPIIFVKTRVNAMSIDECKRRLNVLWTTECNFKVN